jgi:glyoxylase-like metal-dependent hydrolase (beta-lactamase superfamily II)
VLPKNHLQKVKIHVINTGFFKLDGGAMFGVVPKTLWSRHVPSDDKNLCNWAARCLLVEDGEKRILIDTGLGDKQNEKFFGYYYRTGSETLLSSIAGAGFSPEDITDVILTHLHFDHVGGAVRYKTDKPVLTFPNARYWSTEEQWQWATRPNPREKASFLPENILPLQESGHLSFIRRNDSPFDHITFLHVDGHTEQMILPLITDGNKKYLFAADLIPSSAHLPIAWVMGYDVRPLITMEEKQTVLETVLKEKITLIFEHDAIYEAATVERGEKGIQISARGSLSDFI